MTRKAAVRAQNPIPPRWWNIWDGLQSLGSVGKRLGIGYEHPYDFSEAQRGYGQVVIAEPQGRSAYQQADEGGAEAGYEQSQR
jgi:hypothetical protein